MANNFTSEVSYLILDSLTTGSKYGLEIIEYISNKTGNNYIMKKPTLYSSLTRMEKKGYVSSSYWETSEMGGKRHYYTITAEGKNVLAELAKEFENSTFEDLYSDAPQVQPQAEQPTETSDKPVILQQDNIFSMVEEKKETSPSPESQTETGVLDNQIDFFSFQKSELERQEQEKKDYYQNILESTQKKDDAVFLQDTERLTDEQQKQNQQLYDSSSELTKYRKRKSFSENQIEMSVVYENEEDKEIQRERIEALKASLLGARENANQKTEIEKNLEKSATPLPQFIAEEQTMPDSPVSEENTESQKNLDDAVFITSRYSDDEIPIQKKITPPNIEIDVSDSNLPAPKRDANLEPTYKDMMSKLFERKKEKEQAKQQSKPETSSAHTAVKSENYNDMDSFVDYSSLQKYYAGHGIDFKEYKKTSVERVHNTNFLVFLSSVILFMLAGVGSAILCGILAWAKVLNTNSNFLFYTIPVLFAIYMIFTFVRYKLYPSKKAVLLYNSVINWAVFVLSFVVIVVINIICGMQYEIIKKFMSSLLIPAYAILLAFPVNYYIKKFLFKRYAK